MPQITQIITDFFGTRMTRIKQIFTDFFATDYTDFHKFLSVFIRSIRVLIVSGYDVLFTPQITQIFTNFYLCLSVASVLSVCETL